jgi:hypothetical protein
MGWPPLCVRNPVLKVVCMKRSAVLYSAISYIATFFSAFLALVALTVCWGLIGRDHFAAITSGHGPTWYQDLGGDAVTEIQDQDIFYHNIGSSIDNLRRADVVIVGSSLVAFAIDGTVVKDVLGNKHGLSFYNLSFVGISSGEFTRRLMEKYQIHPKLLIINADDGGGGGNFFGAGIQRSFSGDVKTIAATEHNRITAFKEVARRNMRWRLEGLFKTLFHSTALERDDRVPIPRFYRDAATGDADMIAFPKYENIDNPATLIKRDPDCHTTDEVVGRAKDFVRDIGGEVVLTIIPNTHYCEQQAREIANKLGIELVLPGKLTYSSWDGSGHYDRRGSFEFTTDFIAALEKTATFMRLENTARESE